MTNENDASLPPIRVPSALLAAAKAQADRRDETLSQVVRRALRNYAASGFDEAEPERAISIMHPVRAPNQVRSRTEKLGRLLVRHLGDSLGTPTRFQQFVGEHPGLRVPLQKPGKSVGSGDVVRWDTWRLEFNPLRESKGGIQFWSGTHPGYGASWETFEPLANFTTETVVECWSCDIADVAGLSASRAHLDHYATLDELAESEFPSLLHPVSEDQLSTLLAKGIHSEFLNITDPEKSSIRFHRYTWDDGRIYIGNSVDMHPLIAARYIAKRLNKRVRLHGLLHTQSINLDAAKTLVETFDIYTLPGKVSLEFGDAMRMFEAPYGIYGLPRGILFDTGNGMTRYLGASLGMSTGDEGEARNVRLILLPKEDNRAMQVSKVLREANLFDAGSFILDMTRRQASSQTVT